MKSQNEIAELGAFRILIVEDNKVNQLLVRNMLTNFGFKKFDCAESGKVALEKLTQNTYDLILMDIQMPEMNGYEITTEIRTNFPTSISNIPIIALTANASEKERAYADEIGMNDYIIKPYTPEELYTAITFHITGAAAGSSSPVIDPEKQRIKQPKRPAFSLKKYTGGDDELEIQLIEIFLRQIPEAIHKFETSIPKDNWKQVYNIAHKLKGSIAIFELHDLKKLLIFIEEYSREQKHLHEVPLLFDQFKKLSITAIEDLETQLQKLKLDANPDSYRD